MLKCIMAFYDHCQKAIADSPAEAKVTWATIKVAQASIIQKVVDTKFVEPKESEERMRRTTTRRERDQVVVCGHVGRLIESLIRGGL